jgi:hypothetical protein
MTDKDLGMNGIGGMTRERLMELLVQAHAENVRKDTVIESQKQAIADQQESIEKQEQAIEGHKRTIIGQMKVIESDKRVIAELNELLRLQRAKPYIPSTEQMEFLFQETEAIAEGTPGTEGKEEETVDVKGFKRRKRSHAVATLPADTPVVIIDHGKDAPAQMLKDRASPTGGSGTRSSTRRPSFPQGTPSSGTFTPSMGPWGSRWTAETRLSPTGTRGSTPSRRAPRWWRVRWWASTTTIFRSTGRRRCSGGKAWKSRGREPGRMDHQIL